MEVSSVFKWQKKLTQVKIKAKKAELIYYVLASFREKPESAE